MAAGSEHADDRAAAEHNEAAAREILGKYRKMRNTQLLELAVLLRQLVEVGRERSAVGRARARAIRRQRVDALLVGHEQQDVRRDRGAGERKPQR